MNCEWENEEILKRTIFTFYIQTSIRHCIIFNNRKRKIISFSFWNGSSPAIFLRRPHDEDTSIGPGLVMGKMVGYFFFFFFLFFALLDALAAGREWCQERSIACNKLSRSSSVWIECFPNDFFPSISWLRGMKCQKCIHSYHLGSAHILSFRLPKIQQNELNSAVRVVSILIFFIFDSVAFHREENRDFGMMMHTTPMNCKIVSKEHLSVDCISHVIRQYRLKAWRWIEFCCIS